MLHIYSYIRLHVLCKMETIKLCSDIYLYVGQGGAISAFVDILVCHSDFIQIIDKNLILIYYS